eukprot:scaffold5836_cov54-Attheya_sp.AAC.2
MVKLGEIAQNTKIKFYEKFSVRNYSVVQLSSATKRKLEGANNVQKIAQQKAKSLGQKLQDKLSAAVQRKEAFTAKIAKRSALKKSARKRGKELDRKLQDVIKRKEARSFKYTNHIKSKLESKQKKCANAKKEALSNTKKLEKLIQRKLLLSADKREHNFIASVTKRAASRSKQVDLGVERENQQHLAAEKLSDIKLKAKTHSAQRRRQDRLVQLKTQLLSSRENKEERAYLIMRQKEAQIFELERILQRKRASAEKSRHFFLVERTITTASYSGSKLSTEGAPTTISQECIDRKVSAAMVRKHIILANRLQETGLHVKKCRETAMKFNAIKALSSTLSTSTPTGW